MQDFREEEVLKRSFDAGLMRRLLGYARPFAGVILLCIGLLVVGAATDLARPYLIKVAIDEHLTGWSGLGTAQRAAAAGAIWRIAFLLLGLQVLGFVASYVQGYVLQRTGQRIIYRIRQELFQHLGHLSLSFFDRNPVGRLVTRVANDTEALNEMYTSVVVNLFRDIFTLGGVMLIMFQLDVRLALVALAVVPALALAAYLFQHYSVDAWRQVRVRLARINAYLAENISGMAVVQIFHREERQAASFDEINRSYIDASMRQLYVFSFFRPFIGLLSSLALALIVWYGGGQVLQATVSFGVVFAFTNYIQQMFGPIEQLAEKLNIIQQAMASSERIFNLMDEPPAVADPAPGADPAAAVPAAADPPAVGGAGADADEAATATAAVPVTDKSSAVVSGSVMAGAGGHPIAAGDGGGPPVRRPRGEVEFDGVWFAYEGENWVLRDITFRVAPGQTIAFVGHTGAGKSSIMNLVLRFYDVQQGAVRIDGVDVRHLPQAALRRHMAIVMQDVFLFTGDVAGNIRLGNREIDDHTLQAAARTVGADQFIRSLPGGYAHSVVERGATLSQGQRQLIAFARALAFDPAILVLDEATASIDSETEWQIQEGLQALSRGRTTLIVAHRLSTIQHADRIIVLHRGRIREEGTHQELLALGGIYYKLWELQRTEAGVPADGR